jgi:two-component system response regulator AtoC
MEQTAPPIVGVSKDIERINDLIHHIASTGLNVVISGETGVGKEVVAQNLYKNSNRANQPFVKVNCAALPEGLLESELYGYEQGAFTGAERKKRGKFELANGGVLFLDEIGDMPIKLQSKLLHVLQCGEFAPLGSEKDIKTDTWIITSTNHDLEKAIIEKRFREDLFYRLNIIKIYIPPLRERPEDIQHLIDHYLNIYTSQFNKKKYLSPDKKTTERLIEYPWPGNVRELQNVLKRVLVLGNWEEIVDELYKDTKSGSHSASEGSTVDIPSIIKTLLNLEDKNFPNSDSFSLKKLTKKTVNAIEKETISYVLEKTNWNRSKASKILKVSYKTLLFKINELNIIPPA